MRVQIAVAVVTVLAGCVSSPLGTSSSDQPAAEWARQVIDPATQGFEPTIAVSGSSIVVCSPVDPGRGSYVWASGDAGTTWRGISTTDPAGRANPTTDPAYLGGGDCDLATGPDGRLWLADAWLGSISVAVSDDGGQHWVPRTAFTATGVALDRPFILASSWGDLFLTYGSPQATNWEPYGLPTPPIGGIAITRSSDDGKTWSPPILLPALPDGAERIGLSGNMVESGGRLLLPFTSKAGTGQLTLQVALSDDRGRAWTIEEVATVPFRDQNCFAPLYYWPTMAGNERGDVLLSAAVATDQGPTLFAVESSDRGDTWTPSEIPAPAGTHYFATAALDDTGRAIAAFYGSNVSVLFDKQPNPVSCTSNTPETAEWRLMVYARASPGGAWSEGPEGPVIHVGRLGRPYAERLGAAFHDGDAVLAFVSDETGVEAAPMFGRLPL